MFIDKQQILLDTFSRNLHRLQVLSQFLHDKGYLSLQLSVTGIVIDYYTSDELHNKFGSSIPDNIDGDVLLVYNLEDACRVLDCD